MKESRFTGGLLGQIGTNILVFFIDAYYAWFRCALGRLYQRKMASQAYNN